MNKFILTCKYDKHELRLIVQIYDNKRTMRRAIKNAQKLLYNYTHLLYNCSRHSAEAACVGKWKSLKSKKNLEKPISLQLFFYKPALDWIIIHEVSHAIQFTFPRLFAKIGKDVLDVQASEAIAQLHALSYYGIKQQIDK